MAQQALNEGGEVADDARLDGSRVVQKLNKSTAIASDMILDDFAQVILNVR